ncbi:GPW/gp25 family protein, partial [Escherichia coli]
MISFLKKISDDNSSSGYDNCIQFSDSDLKNEISMLLTSRPLFPDLEDLTYICDSVINYGVNSSLLNIVTQEEQTLEIIRRITIALKRFEPRISDIIVMHKEVNDIKYVFTV